MLVHLLRYDGIYVYSYWYYLILLISGLLVSGIGMLVYENRFINSNTALVVKVYVCWATLEIAKKKSSFNDINFFNLNW